MRRLSRALTGGLAAALVALLAGAPAAASTAPVSSPFKFTRSTLLPPVNDATGLRGARMVRAPRVVLPGAGAEGTAQLSVRSGGHDRPYLLAPARRVAPRSRAGLLIVLPAANTTLRAEYDRNAFDAYRDHGLTVLVAGTYAATWNAGRCCFRPMREGIDDVAAVQAMRADAVRRTGADPARTAVIGHSVGGMMAWRLACTPSFGAQAVVAVSGTLVAPCPTLPAVPQFLALNGTADTTMPIDGGTKVVPLLGIAPPSVRRSLTTLAGAAGCTRRVATAETVVHVDCRGGRSVRLTAVAGAGHAWPGLEATRRSAAFLSAALVGVR